MELVARSEGSHYFYVFNIQGVQLKGELAGQSESDTIHTDELYRSSLNLVSSCRDTQVGMFHPQKMVMLTRIMFSARFFFIAWTTIPPQWTKYVHWMIIWSDLAVKVTVCGAIKM